MTFFLMDVINTVNSIREVNKEIPIFADDYVDMEFGTGCVKVTPAHDPNDFEMGQRNNITRSMHLY